MVLEFWWTLHGENWQSNIGIIKHVSISDGYLLAYHVLYEQKACKIKYIAYMMEEDVTKANLPKKKLSNSSSVAN